MSLDLKCPESLETGEKGDINMNDYETVRNETLYDINNGPGLLHMFQGSRHSSA